MIRDLAIMSWEDVAKALPLRLPALLPIGACEQHGAHLPLTVDTDIARGVARRIANATGAFVLPALAYGDAWSARSFPGTVSIRPDTLRALVTDIGTDLHRQGHAALITVNGHFGNRGPIALAARDLAEIGLPVLMLDHPGIEALAADICDSPPAAPAFYHADEVETSMMLALRTDAVRLEQAQPEYPIFPDGYGTEPTQLRDISASGVFGDPRPATADKGTAFLNGITRTALPLIAAFLARHDLPPIEADPPWQP